CIVTKVGSRPLQKANKEIVKSVKNVVLSLSKGIVLNYCPSIVLINPRSSYSNSTIFMLRNHVFPPDGTASWKNRYHFPLNSKMLWCVVQPTTGVSMTP